MKTRAFRPLLLGVSALSLLLAAPASAQLSVFDPTNYAQNLLQAGRALQQINNQITSLQNEAQSLINQARNLASLPTNALSGIQQSIDRTRQLIGQAQQIAYNVRDIDRVFDERYPAGSLSGTSSGTLVENAETRWRDAVAGFQDSLRTQATIVTNLGDTRSQIDTLMGASQDATGALQAAQAGNQLTALQTRQLANLTALMAAQNRSASIAAARAAADEAQGREQTKRFIAPGTGYVPHSVTLFRDCARGSGGAQPFRQPQLAVGCDRGCGRGDRHCHASSHQRSGLRGVPLHDRREPRPPAGDQRRSAARRTLALSNFACDR